MASRRLSGFWSYVREDDEAENGRIRSLAHAIQHEYAMLTGEQIEVFLDRDSLQWGDEWQREIDQALSGTAFFIPVITPRYFLSSACRSELLLFAAQAESLGVTQLLLPLLYVDVPDLDRDNTDPAVTLVAGTQFVDWRTLRFEAEESSSYRREVNALATRLAEISRSTGEPSRDASKSAERVSSDEDEEPGLVEILAELEDAMPRWSSTINEFGEALAEVGAVGEEFGAKIERSNAAGKGFGARLYIVRELAGRLREPASRILELGSTYSSHLIAIDAGVLTLIRLADEQWEETDQDQVCEFFASIRGLRDATTESAESLIGLVAALDETATLSKELRPPLRQIKEGLQGVQDSRAIMDEWARRIDHSSIDCSSSTASTGH